MKRETLKALNESIKHWIRLRDGKQGPYETIGPQNCALCERFSCGTCVIVDYETGKAIERCPIRIKTNETACAGTPYAQVSEMWHLAGVREGIVWRKAADKMVRFLRSLKPKAKPREG